jgi:hypothetical protein
MRHEVKKKEFGFSKSCFLNWVGPGCCTLVVCFLDWLRFGGKIKNNQQTADGWKRTNDPCSSFFCLFFLEKIVYDRKIRWLHPEDVQR